MSDITEAYKRLTPHQKQVVDTIEGPVLVIAGPGTGKTHVLTMRIANILSKTDTSPQNILCLTFTESAAQTMRTRLASLTGLTAHNVTFSTYHAFGSELIQRFPEFFTDLREARPVDELGIATILSDLLDKTSYANPLKRAQVSIKDVKEIVSELKRALITPNTLREVVRNNRSFIVAASKEVSAILKSLKRIDRASVSLFAQLARVKCPAKTADQTTITELSTLWQETLEMALMDVETSGKTTALTEWKNNWLAKNNQNRFIVDGIRTVERLEALADIYEQYLKTLRQTKLYDYDDMILQAINGLESAADLRYTLQEQYQYILLDEFQDTNEAQMRLVELLTNNPVNEGKPNIMAVGDDDQAIFGFQGAHYSHMAHFTELYRDVAVISLNENFRSHSNILSIATHIGMQIKERLHQQLRHADKQLTAANKTLPKDAIVDYSEFSSDIAQFAWVAREAKRLVDNGTPASEIALIAPQHKYLEPMIASLHQVGLTVRYEKRENILDDPFIKQLSRMIELILALQHDNQALANSLWPEVLSFPYWHVATKVLWQLSWEAYDKQKNWLELLADVPELENIAMFFVRLSWLANTENLETMLDYLVGIQPIELLTPQTPLYHAPMYAYFSRSEAALWQALTHLTVLREKLKTYKSDTDEPLQLEDFKEFVQAYKNAGLKLLNTSPYYEATDAVQLMTAYKAKGQEFSAVFVLACLEEVWGTKAKGQSSRIPLPPNLQFIRYGGLTDDERIRLLFVAITRAKQYLYLTSYTSTFDGRQTTRLSYLEEVNRYTATSQKKVQLYDTEKLLRPTSANLSAYWQNRHTLQSTSSAMRSLLGKRLQKYLLSPTHLNAFTDVIYGGPEQFYTNTILRFPKAPIPTAQFGNAVHETLEWLHIYNKNQGRVPSFKQTQAYFNRQLIAKRLSTHHYEQLLERGSAALTAYWEQRQHTVDASNECEKAFYNEGVFWGDAHLSGKIDKLIINKQTKLITVVDYKTGKSFSRWNSSEVKLHKYRQQLYFYKLLVENSHSFAGYQVSDAYLEFVEPDDEGHITELHLAFDDTYMKRVKALISAMWKQVHALNFPSIESYPATMKGILAFEDDLLTGKL